MLIISLTGPYGQSQPMHDTMIPPLTPTLVLAGDREGDLYRGDDGDDSWQSSSLSASRIT